MITVIDGLGGAKYHADLYLVHGICMEAIIDWQAEGLLVPHAVTIGMPLIPPGVMMHGTRITLLIC